MRLFEVIRETAAVWLRQVTVAALLSVTDRSSCRFGWTVALRACRRDLGARGSYDLGPYHRF